MVDQANIYRIPEYKKELRMTIYSNVCLTPCPNRFFPSLLRSTYMGKSE